MSASQGLSKPGWNMPVLTSTAAQRTPEDSDEDKTQHDGASSAHGDAAKLTDPETGAPLSEVSVSDREVVDANEQAGVQKVEAITLTWSKTSLRLIYVK